MKTEQLDRIHDLAQKIINECLHLPPLATSDAINGFAEQIAREVEAIRIEGHGGAA